MVLTLVGLILAFVSLLLIGVVLLQPGKGDMLSGMGGMGQFNSLLGNRRAMDLLQKVTWGLAIFIFVVSLATNKFLVKTTIATQKAVTETRSIPTSTPVAPKSTPAPRR